MDCKDNKIFDNEEIKERCEIVKEDESVTEIGKTSSASYPPPNVIQGSDKVSDGKPSPKNAKKPPLIPIVVGVVLVLAVALVLAFGGFFGDKGNNGSEGSDGSDSGEGLFGCLHLLTDWVIENEPTCTDEGAKRKVCSTCGETVKSEAIPAKGHSGTTVPAVEADCYTWGNNEYIYCTECSYSNYEATEPTHNITDGVCTRCNREVITTSEALMSIRLDGDYVLGCDIVFDEVINEPIGNSIDHFTGSLDGNGYAISGLKMYQHMYSSQRYALIAMNYGKINNIRLENYYVEARQNVDAVASLVSYNYGSITNCSSNGEINGLGNAGGLVGFNFGTIENCFSKGTVRGKDNAGGLVAINRSEIKNSYSEAEIIAMSDAYVYMNAGGFVGSNFGKIECCYSTGNVEFTSHQYYAHVGGFVGENGNIIISCYSTGDVTSPESSRIMIMGGFVGWNCSGGDNIRAVIINCYSLGDVNMNKTYAYYSNDKDYIGGFVGKNERTVIDSCYSTGSIKANATAFLSIGGFTGSNSSPVNNCFTTSDIYVKQNYSSGQCNIGAFSGTPEKDFAISDSCYVSDEQKITYLKNEVEKELSGIKKYSLPKVTLMSEEWLSDGYWIESGVWDFAGEQPTINFEYFNNHEPISVSTKDQLLALSNRALSLDYVLTRDIDLSGTEWNPIIVSVGEFDGAGRSISGLNFAFYDRRAGFMGQNSGIVTDLNLVDFTIFNNDLAKTFNYFAGIVCINTGKIIGCSAEGDISLNAMVGDNIKRFVGGLCARSDNGSEIFGSSANVNINVRMTAIGGTMYVGGICGLFASDDGKKIDRCYSTGDITVYGYGDKNVGGFAGYGYNISNCYSEGDVNVTNSGDECEIGGFIGSGHAEYSYSLGNLTAIVYKGGVKAGGFVGLGRGEYCFTLGNVDVTLAQNHNMTYQDYDVGGFVGYTSEKYATNSYAPTNQVIKYKNKDFTNDYGTNTKHETHISASEIKSVRFQSEILGFPADAWNIVEGKTPTLKPYAE